MSRSQYGRHSSSDLGYAEEPQTQRWDRDRFERYSRRPAAPVEERETFRFTEHDRPGRQDIRIEERIDRGPPPRRERNDFAEDSYGPAARPRRSDRELFGDRDPRELADLQLAPYRRKSIVERDDFDFRETRNAPRPGGLQRRQSSLDTFDRRPLRRHEHDDYRIPPGVPIPLPRRRSPSRGPPGRYYEEEYEDVRHRDYSPQDSYRDVEIMREKSVHRRRVNRDRARSDARSSTTKRSSRTTRSSSSSSQSSFTEVSRHSSPSPAKVGKKGKTRMPKRLVRKEAIINLGYPFEEEEDFIVVQRALDKEHIDEVIRISEQYKEPKTKTYRYDDPGAPPEEHFEHLRTEWINPPTVRAPSPARSTRTRRSSPARTVRQPSPASPPQPQTIYIRDPAPPPPPAPIYIREQAPAPPPAPIYIHEPSRPAPPQQQPMTIVLPERRREHSRDVHAEVRALEAEARALRLEREAQHHHHGQIVLAQPQQSGYEMVEYRERRPDREIVEYVERDRSPKREVIRVEKDRKGRMALVRSAR
ncbi:hypothetical protein E4T47_08203 [Aureobasidium subglaciale]|nr:hypothetical protein E4T47_08203 [Aureobasidium subglaciale]